MKRRRFLNSMCTLAAAAGAAGTLGRLELMSSALAGTPGVEPGYRALVCVYLFGGIDSFSLMVPMDAERYSPYSQARGPLAVPLGDLLPLNLIEPSDALVGLPPQAVELADLFHAGRLAWVSDIGTLLQPTDRVSFLSGAAELPPQLFSHNDQQAQWMRGSANVRDAEGWAGRVADLLEPSHNSGPTPMNLSLFGSNLLQVGRVSAPYDLTVDGVVPLLGFDAFLPRAAARRAALMSLIDAANPDAGLGHSHLMVREFARRHRRARDLELLVADAINQAPALSTPLPSGNHLAMQLRVVARMVSVSRMLGASRQIFFVGLGGFDTHAAQQDDLPPLISTLGAGLRWFDRALDELGARELVTTFSASEFGRTLSRNQTGTDHGWAGHQLVTGGAVRGGRIVGSLPDFAPGGPRDAGEGRMIPTTATDQLHASLATWMGVPAASLSTVFPRLSMFPGGSLPLF